MWARIRASKYVCRRARLRASGTLTLKAGKVRFAPAPGVAVTMNGAPAKETELKPDVDANYDRLAVGRVKFFIIKREDKMGVRIKDNDSATRREFSGLKWYPVDPSWRVQAEYTPFVKPHTVTFDTAAGVKEQDQIPGYVTFRIDGRFGREYRLEPVVDDNELWFVMRDQTSGKTTYGASRFLYAPLPKNGLKKAGTVEIDFNKAENPPCVFTDFATLPAASAAESLASRGDSGRADVRQAALTRRQSLIWLFFGDNHAVQRVALLGRVDDILALGYLCRRRCACRRASRSRRG